MVDEGDRLDAFLRAQRDGNEEEARRLLDAAPTHALRRLVNLRRKAQAMQAELEPEAAEPGLPFERLDEYRLLRRIGEGGMGQLFLAEQESLGRKVALKVIQAALLGSPTARERFRREALAAARLHHPNLVTVFATGEDQGVAYIVMEYVRGRGMDELLRESRPGTRRVVRWGVRLARALAYAHDRGVLHRDVKPSNTLINEADEPILLDFGIARDERWTGRTVTEAFTGSLPYAAPEQLAGRSVDGRVDIYALAATLYEALTGRLPIPGGSSLEALLTKEPIPPRRYNPALSPDLQTVLLKALEKAPDRRYASAGDFADDLEAILELRPISARPPHGFDRLRRAARHHPRLTAASISAIVALLLFVGYLVHARVERQSEARRLVSAAAERLERYREEQNEIAELESEIVELGNRRFKEYLGHAEDASLDDGEQRVHEARRNREVAFYDVLDLLRRAGELDPTLARVEEVRIDLYMQRWRDALREGDAEKQRFYGDLVRERDRIGRHRAELIGDGRVRIETDPAGAEIHRYRLVEQSEVVPGGEPRLVPFAGKSPVPPGTFALRVVFGPDGWREGDLILELNGHALRDTLFVLEDAGPFRKGDRLLEVNGEPARAGYPFPATGDDRPRYTVLRNDERIEASLGALAIGDGRALAEAGGVRAEVWREEGLSTLTLPTGLDLRLTAVPVFFTAQSRWKTTPTQAQRMPRGRWLFVIRKPGYKEQRMALAADQGVTWTLQTRLIPLREHRPGWVRIVSCANQPEPFWIMEREVTAAEYLEFLNDPSTLARIVASKERILYPRDITIQGDRSYWDRDADGRFVLADDWEKDWPVVGVSFEDAKAYARWRTKRADGRVRFDLPRYGQWIRAANGHALSPYPFGDRIRPKWISSVHSRPKPSPEAVMSYPIDASILGVFDMAGSAAEWLDDWYTPELRRVGGGSWAHGDREQLKIFGQGFKSDRVAGTVGFRLVMTEER
ncbi:MAG: bifunctional serine/threonine-protein kinase/formylglycine-generating enzyme family protein [Planctomycetota bacterium]|jgi:serine/threonine protein kinase